MTEKIVFETEVKTGNSATSVKSVKAELRDLKNQMAALDGSSQEFVKMAQRAGELEDAIGDANAAVKAFNPEAKLQAIVGVVGGVANGFAAAQGAMALFGGESEELEKLMAKTQGAIALATGINGLMGMKDAFINLGNVIKVNVVGAFTTLKGAILATGIGALVIAIGVAINEIIKYNEAIDEEANAQERLNDELKKTEDLMAGVATASEKKRNAQKGGLDDLKREKELLEAKGATEKEIFEKGQEIANKELQNLKARKYSGLDVSKEIADKENEILVNKAAYETKQKEEAAKKQKEFLEKKLEAEKQHELDLAEWRKEADERKKKEDKKRDDEYLALQKKLQVDLPKQFSQEQINNIKNAKSVKQRLDEEEAAAKIAQLQMISSALGGYTQLLGQQTAAGKALAVAQTSIDTYISASAAFKNVMQSPLSKFMPDGGLSLAIIAAGGAVAAGIANVRRIVSVQVPGGGGGGNTAPSAGGSQSVPQFNPAVAQQVQGGGDVQLGMKPQKVYVVESDIRGTMNKVDVIEANATIG
jgi:hypothetical protein